MAEHPPDSRFVDRGPLLNIVNATDWSNDGRSSAGSAAASGWKSMKTKLLSALIFLICLVAAAQTTEKEWQQEAIRRYPALGVLGTPLNKAFVAEYTRRKQLPSEAPFFANPRWPMLLADECARQVGLAGAQTPSPHPAVISADQPTLATSVAMRIALGIGVVVGFFVGAVCVQLATRIVAGFLPPFGTAAGAILLAIAVSLALRFIFWVGGQSGTEVLAFVLGFCAQCGIYGNLLCHPEVGRIGWAKGFWISILQIVFSACILLPIVLVAVMALPVFGMIQQKAKETESLSQAKRIVTACRLYAVDNQGKFPPTLDALVPNYVPDKGLFASPFQPSVPMGYTYTSGITESSPRDAIVLEDIFSVQMAHARVVCRADSSAQAIPAR